MTTANGPVNRPPGLTMDPAPTRNGKRRSWNPTTALMLVITVFCVLVFTLVIAGNAVFRRYFSPIVAVQPPSSQPGKSERMITVTDALSLITAGANLSKPVTQPTAASVIERVSTTLPNVQPTPVTVNIPTTQPSNFTFSPVFSMNIRVERAIPATQPVLTPVTHVDVQAVQPVQSAPADQIRSMSQTITSPSTDRRVEEVRQLEPDRQVFGRGSVR